MQSCAASATTTTMSLVILAIVYLHLATGAAEGRNFAYNSTRYSFTASRPDTRAAEIKLDAAARTRGYRDPHGVKVHASMKTVRWANSGRSRCRFGTGCETSSVCGSKCEPILLRVAIPCDSSGWCPSARKFLRCYPVLCLNSRSGISRSRVDSNEFAILRWKRPVPKYEREARRNRQSSTQSAIFRS